MATIVITIDISEDSFDADEHMIDFRDNFGDTICRIAEAIDPDRNITAQVDHVD